MNMSQRSGRFDSIVVGVGGMGLATSYYLARRGKRVLGLERFGIPHSMGSSHGHTRIIRLAYYEHPSYVLLLKRAYELWREIQRIASERLLHITGSIDAGPEDSWVFKGSWESCRLHDLPHEVLTGAELHRRFPGYHLPADHLALVQPEGGFLTPEKCIVSYVMAAQALGAEIHGHERVFEWRPLEGGVRVRTDHGVYEADKLVITAGAWDGELLDVDEGRFYGFPVHGVPGFKFGKYHHLEEKVDPETVDREAHDYDERLLRDFAERYFPDGCGPTMDLQTCMFTNTPDNHFIIDMHPEYDQVSFASPCSGHGYKFASVIGEIMADLGDTGITRHDVTLFRLDRLTRPSRGLPGRAHPAMGTTDREAHQQNGRPRSFPRVPEIRPFW